MGEHHSAVWHKVREIGTHWAIGGVLLALTGLAPEEWLAHVLHGLHVPEDALHLWSAGIDARIVPVTAGVAFVVGDMMLRRHAPHAQPVPVAGVAHEHAALADAATPAPPAAAPVVALPDLNPVKAPRISVAVMPFRNLSTDPNEDYLADGITDDLTTDLARIPDAFVTARDSAYTYKNATVNVRQAGAELGVRYLVEGSTRRIGSVLRVNVQLVSTEDGTGVWSDRFDVEISDMGSGQDEIVNRIQTALGVQLIDIEILRGAQAAPDNPDAFDWVLRARSLLNQPASENRSAEARVWFERALTIDPASVSAMLGLAQVLCRQKHLFEPPKNERPDLERADRLVALAERLEPNSLRVLQARAQLLQAQERWTAAIEAYRRVVNIDSNAYTAYAGMALCLFHVGRNEEAIPLHLRFIRMNPRDPNLWWVYEHLGQALLGLGRYEEAMPWYERALSSHPDNNPETLATQHRMLAAARMLTGKPEEARREMAEATRLSPWRTTRFYTTLAWSAAMAAQMVPIVDALRQAGMRDHADEDADWGVPSTAELHMPQAGHTPTAIPGGTVIRTPDLATLIAEKHPVILDINQGPVSLPGALALRGAGRLEERVAHETGARLRKAIDGVLGGDIARPIVTVGWNSERWGGRNLALRLIALGYPNVYWYRGGREAWEVNGLPMAPLKELAW